MGSLSMVRRIVLASASPRRRQLLAELGVPLRVVPSNVLEKTRRGEAVRDCVVRLARAKASAAAAPLPDEVVLAADTLVAVDGRILEKPRDAADGSRMLRRLSGRTHEVVTGVAIRHQDGIAIGRQRSTVTFRTLAPHEIAWYVATGEGADKAGGYALQGKGAYLIRSIRGSYTNVIGLPLELVQRMLQRLGVDLLRVAAAGNRERPRRV